MNECMRRFDKCLPYWESRLRVLVRLTARRRAILPYVWFTLSPPLHLFLSFSPNPLPSLPLPLPPWGSISLSRFWVQPFAVLLRGVAFCRPLADPSWSHWRNLWIHSNFMMGARGQAMLPAWLVTSNCLLECTRTSMCAVFEVADSHTQRAAYATWKVTTSANLRVASWCPATFSDLKTSWICERSEHRIAPIPNHLFAMITCKSFVVNQRKLYQDSWQREDRKWFHQETFDLVIVHVVIACAALHLFMSLKVTCTISLASVTRLSGNARLNALSQTRVEACTKPPRYMPPNSCDPSPAVSAQTARAHVIIDALTLLPDTA